MRFVPALLLSVSVLAACSPKAAEHGAEPHGESEHGDAHGEAHGESHGGSGAPVGKWTYDGPTGPDHWGQLGGDAAVCASGMRQSPVDIARPVRPQFSKVALNYNSVTATIQNTGKTVSIVPASGGALELDGVSYPLTRIEFHSPSEHSLNGRRSTLESQFVHVNAHGETVVIAVLYDIGAADPMLGSLWTYLPTDPGQPIAIPDLLINAEQLMPSTADYYAYAGSLTTPPCTEGVTWLVATTPLSVSAEQADAFERLVGPNARPLQKQNGRDYLHVSAIN